MWCRNSSNDWNQVKSPHIMNIFAKLVCISFITSLFNETIIPIVQFSTFKRFVIAFDSLFYTGPFGIRKENFSIGTLRMMGKVEQDISKKLG